MQIKKITTRVQWSDDHEKEVAVLWFFFLNKQVKGEKVVKSKYYQALADKQGRSKGSIETKLMNCSAIAQENGLPAVKGYKALSNYSKSMKVNFELILREFANTEAKPDLSIAS